MLMRDVVVKSQAEIGHKKHGSAPPPSAGSRDVGALLVRKPCADAALTIERSRTTVLHVIMPAGAMGVTVARHYGSGCAETHVSIYRRHIADLQGSWCPHSLVGGTLDRQTKKFALEADARQLLEFLP